MCDSDGGDSGDDNGGDDSCEDYYGDGGDRGVGNGGDDGCEDCVMMEVIVVNLETLIVVMMGVKTVMVMEVIVEI